MILTKEEAKRLLREELKTMPMDDQTLYSETVQNLESLLRKYPTVRDAFTVIIYSAISGYDQVELFEDGGARGR